MRIPIFLSRLFPTLAAVAIGLPAAADQGTVVKWSQRPGGIDTGEMLGENIASDVDWRDLMSEEPVAPNWVAADDFVSDGRPILTLRWWGSYFDPAFLPVVDEDSGSLVPTVEDGFLISFFSDVPDPNPDDPDTFSMPGTLLGSYVAPVLAVRITDTGLVGWDEHEIFQYEVNLQDTHLDHASDIATPIAFEEQQGTIYWVAITAENGHRLVEDWNFEDTGDPVLESHYWGWHTSPEAFNDVATMGTLDMPGNVWDYGSWNPIQPAHGELDLAFELLTVPEPGTAALGGMGLLGLMALGRRRGAWTRRPGAAQPPRTRSFTSRS